VDKEVMKVGTLPLSPTTKEFAYVRFTVENSRRVILVDTPAFPDPILGNTFPAAEKVGKKISKWLKEA
jgi:hypothetical protein